MVLRDVGLESPIGERVFEGSGQTAAGTSQAWESRSQCSLCGSLPSHWAVFESRPSGEGLLTYVLCRVCGLVFMDPKPTEPALTEFYAANYRVQVQGQEGPTSKDRWAQKRRASHLLDLARPAIPKVARHLDIGCSLGELLDAFRDRYQCESLGIEPGEAYRELGRRRGLNVFPGLESLPAEFRSRIDLISLAHVLEHLPEPVEFLRRVRRDWMVPGGHLIVEVPNLLCHPSLEPSHLTAFHAQSLRWTIEAAGFRAVRIKTHGRPHSRLLPLFVTVLAQAAGTGDFAERAGSPVRGLRLRRRLGVSLLRNARGLSRLLLGRRQLRPWEP